VDFQDASVSFAIKLSSHSTLGAIRYGRAVTSLLNNMMFEKTIKAASTNIGDMNEAVGGWDFTSSP